MEREGVSIEIGGWRNNQVGNWIGIFGFERRTIRRSVD